MSKKYSVRQRRGIPWVLLAVISLAIYLYFLDATDEYNLYIIGVTAAVVLIWLYRFIRKKNIAKDYDTISNRLSLHHNERKERDDFNPNVQDSEENKIHSCEFCGATQSTVSDSCENCGKEFT